MKLYHRLSVFVLCLGLMMVSCNDNDDTYQHEQEGMCYEVTDSVMVLAEEYADHLGLGFDFPMVPQASTIYSTVVKLFYNTRLPQLQEFFENESQETGVAGAPWRIASYVFNYPSIAANGEEVTLSARVTFPKYDDENRRHSLSSLTLFSHQFSGQRFLLPSKMEGLLCSRVVFNSAVIEPDYEGYGVSSDRTYCFWSNMTQARQMADCVEAAIKLMEQHHVTLADDGFSTCWGFSMGAPGALAFVRYYETEASEEFRQKVRLHSAAIGCGPLSIEMCFDYLVEYDDAPALTFHWTMLGLNSLEQSRLEGFTLDDLIPVWVKTLQVESSTISGSYLDIWKQNNMIEVAFSLDSSFANMGLSSFLAEDMVNSEGHLIESSPKVKMMRKVLAEENDCWEGWAPQIPLHFVHHPQDGGAPYLPARKFYEELASRGGNVFWHDDTLPEILESRGMKIHLCSYMFNMFRGCMCVYPSEISEILQREN